MIAAGCIGASIRGLALPCDSITDTLHQVTGIELVSAVTHFIFYFFDAEVKMYIPLFYSFSSTAYCNYTHILAFCSVLLSVTVAYKGILCSKSL